MRWKAVVLSRLAAAVVTTVTALAAPSTASADGGTWYYAGLCAGCSEAGGSHNSFTMSKGVLNVSNKKIRASAHWPGGWSLAAPWVEGWGYACQNFNGNSLGPIVNNPHTVALNLVNAVEGYYGGNGPTYC